MSAAPRGASARAGSAALLARAVLAILVLASVGGFFLAQSLKREDPLILQPKSYTDRFQPAGAGALDHDAHFHLKTSIADTLEVSIVTLAGRQVEVIESGLAVRRYRRVGLDWDGRTTAGTPAAPGLYELKVHFERHGDSVIVPGFRLQLERAER